MTPDKIETVKSPRELFKARRPAASPAQSMQQTMNRYFSFICGFTISLMMFVSCGSQFYKVSLEDDTQATSYPGRKGVHAVSGWDRLPIEFYIGQNMNPSHQTGIRTALKTWELAVGRQLFSFKGIHTDVNGDSFQDLYGSLEDFFNGHYIDSDWSKTQKPRYVLATTIWRNPPDLPQAISAADIRYNEEFYIIGDSLSLTHDGKREVVDMQSLSLHEIGHLLGLAHISEQDDPHSIMNPSLFIGEGLTSRRLSLGDVERIQSIYGCYGAACDHTKILQLVNDRSVKF